MTIRFRKLVLSLVLSLACSLAVAAASHWPGERLPTLIERWNADLIAYVEVAQAEEIGGVQVSHLKTLSLIKSDGRSDHAEVTVHIQLGSHWPYTFRETNKAIAFLDFDEEKKRYEDFKSTAGIDVSEETGKLFVNQFAKLPKLLKEKDSKSLLKNKVDWYFDFVANPTTRDHATYGIRILWKKAARAKQLTKAQMESAAGLLSASQKESICGILANEVPTNDSYELIELLRDHPSIEIDDYLVKSLKRSLKISGEVPYKGSTISDLAIKLLPARMKFQVPQELAQKLSEHKDRRLEFSYTISISDEYTKDDRDKAKESLIKDWRKMAKEFLEFKALKGT